MILVNGLVNDTVSVLDRGLQYGDGVFTTMAVREGEPLLWEAHWQRLAHGCQRLGFELPSRMALEDEVTRVAQGQTRAVVKVILTRGISQRGYKPAATTGTRIVYGQPWPEFPASNRLTGIRMRVCDLRLSSQPRLAGIKHLNRLENVLARGEWDDSGIAEGLLLDSEGYVIEGTMSNIFIVENGGLRTPDLDQSGVAGVMRAEIMQTAKDNAISVHEDVIRLVDIELADEVFMCNSLIGIWPVRQLGNIVFNKPFTVSQKLQTLLAPVIV